MHQGLKKRSKKKRAHNLNNEHKKNRKTNCRKPYEYHITGDWSEYVVCFAKSFNVVGIITNHGSVPLFRVLSSVKINAQYDVDYVLRQLFTVHLPRLYPNDMDKVYFHHVKASSHTVNSTPAYLVKMKGELSMSIKT